MGLGNLLGRLSRPSGKTLEAPIRAIVHEVLREQGYASPAEVQSLREEARELKTRLDRLEGRLDELAKLLDAARADLATARESKPAPDPRLAQLQADVERLAGELAARPAVPAPDRAMHAEEGPGEAVERGTCKVPG